MNRKITGYVLGYMDKCKQDHIGAFAAQAAFFVMISAIPFLMVFCSLLPFTPVSQQDVMELFQSVLPDYISPLLVQIMGEVYGKNVGVVSVSAVVALWAAGKALQYMTTGLNAVNGIYETRNWLMVRLWSILYTLILVATMIILLIFVIFTGRIQQLVQNRLGVFSIWNGMQPLVRGLVLFGILILLFTILFRTLPDKKLTFRSQIPGAVLCALAWFVFSLGLSVYVNYFHGFSMYGSLTTIVLLMLWLYFDMYIMLLCAQVNVYFSGIFTEFIDQRKQKKE